jgi:hypothetical protein
VSTRREHFVTFYSPGTLFAETTRKPIAEWDARTAVGMADAIVERYDAKPYGFRFDTVLIADPVDDGEGGKLEIKPKCVAESGTHFLGGTLSTLDELEAHSKRDESILRENMRGNGNPIVITVIRGYKSTHIFGENDVVVDAKGGIMERGDDPKHVVYRKDCLARIKSERGW